MGKTADLTAVQKAIIDTLKQEEKGAIRKLKEDMKKKLLSKYKDLSKETETELIEKDAETLVKNYDDIFTLSKRNIRTVLTKGVAGIGKTFQVKKFMVDWANEKSNKNIDLIVSLTFSELNPEKVQSMEEFLNSYFNNVQQGVWNNSSKCKLAFILDGLEQCKLPLGFENNKDLTDLNEPASMDVLLTNLIKGTLLPSDHVWIISQPSGVDRIPSEFIQKMTECRETLKRRQKLVSDLRTRFHREYTQVVKSNHQNHENTEHIIREDITDGVDAQTKVGQTGKKTVKQVSDIFKEADGKKIRSVLTTGEADIGKTFQMNMFIKQWAENKSSIIGWLKSISFNPFTQKKDEELTCIFPLNVSKLSLMNEENTSLLGLLNAFFEETKKSVISDFAQFNLLFLLDGLDEYKHPLDFNHGKTVTDIRETAPVNVLLTELIKGNLLPSAKIWVTSRPSDAERLPADVVQRRTEIREKDAKTKLTERLKKEIKGKYEKEQLKLDTEIYKIQKNVKDKQKLVKTKYNDIFMSKEKQIRTVFTKELSDTGKTQIQTKKFMVDWANTQANSDIDLIVLLTFNELNSIRKPQSMDDFLNQCLPYNKIQGVSIYDKCKLAFILDGLEKCKLPLDFENNKELTDLNEPASMDVLLTNLIKGTLLPSAQLWIISSPSGVNKIPPEYIHNVTECREKDAIRNLKEHMKNKLLSKYKDPNKETETELYEIKSDKKDEETRVKDYNEIFTLSKQKARTVLTRGVAGIGKTFQVKKFMVDWANENSNKNIDLIVSLTFSELNPEKVQSTEELLNCYFISFQQQGVWNSSECKLAFILDGLEQCKLPLDFENNKELTDLNEAASMDVLLTNLIKGTLLPSDHIWIISQPSGVDKIPSEFIQKMTECRETLKRRQKLVSDLRTRFHSKYTQVEDPDHPNQKNTEHIMREDSTDGVNDQDNVGQAEKKTLNSVSDIFKNANGKKIRSVLTAGEADIGKTFQMNMFIKKWAESNSSFFVWLKNQVIKQKKDDELIFPLDFSKLSLMEKNTSLLGILNYCFEETVKSVISDYTQFKLLFLLDGLDAYKHSLDSDHGKTVTDIRETASVNVILMELIKGNLLPTAQIWVTSRPSDAKRLPADVVQRRTEIREKPDIASQRKLKSELRDQFTQVSEGIDKQKTSALLNDIFTDLYIIEGERGEVNSQSETRQVQDAKFKGGEETLIKYHDIFNTTSGETKPIRTVLTIGMAGIGKTFASMKFMLDWAEGKANESIYYTFPLPLRELNLRKDAEHSFEEIINQFFPAMERSEIKDYKKYKILIVLDGFDENRLDLDFGECKKVTDMRTKASVKVLLTNLIQGHLLPEAQIWITSRPAASNNIPAQRIDRVTEVRGFNDEQKEEYFRKRFIDKDLAEKILAHVKKSRSLYIMCHIPVFCWITSEVLEDLISRNQDEGMPKTLTDMYISLLLLQCRQANVKYGGGEDNEGSKKDSCWNTRNKETVLSLAKLAFDELQKGNLLFTKENLTDCGISIENAAVFSGLFTQIKREGRDLYPQKLFCFAHLSIQEFLAAFHASYTFSSKGENLLMIPASTNADLPAFDFYKSAVEKALSCETGDWDLFLRFLLGMSLETNQNLLQDIQKKTENTAKNIKKTIEFIKEKLKEENSNADKNLNLFYCLNELNDHSLVKEVKTFLQSETKEYETFSAAQWSALTFVLLTSDEKLDVFDLKKYLKSEKVLLGMLPVVKVSKTTLLSWCELSEESCRGLMSSVLTSASSNLTELDMSHNDLCDSGVQFLADGLKSLHCKLEILKLAGCQVTEKGCLSLADALKTNRSSHLKELDLRYNHPGDNGMEELSHFPNLKLRFECGGEHRLKSGLKKYAANLVFDENTASKRLVLSEGNRKVRTVKKVDEKVSRPENDNRFKRSQVLCECEEGLDGICYWEVEWAGTVGIAVTYEDVGRRWDRSGGLGCNKNSWSLLCSKKGYKAIHDTISKPLQKSCSQKLGVFLDWESGILRYLDISSEKPILIHEFKVKKFTKPLFPGFWFKRGSVTLCEMG